MTLRQYKVLDIIIFTLIASVIEAATIFLFNYFKAQVFTLSFVFVLGFIAIYRWNSLGLVVACFSSLVGILTRQGLNQTVTLQLYLGYTLSYLGLAIELLFFKLAKFDKKKIREDIAYLSLIYFSSYFLVEILKALFQIGNLDFYKSAVLYFSYDLLNIIFNYVVLLIARKQKNLLVDMKSYVIEVNTPLSQVREIKEKSDYLKMESMCEADEVNEQALLDGGLLTQDDLKELEKSRRKIEGKETIFDKENEAIKLHEMKGEKSK